MNILKLGKQVYGIGLLDKTILGVYMEQGGKVVYIH
jgi:hypothetical protein